eukprot:COSAG05_NODE_3433_length_2066_cov_5.423996_3_plen_166_part_00
MSGARRYCTGGYIFQVSDIAQGELLTGPAGAVHEEGNTFDVFNGQGFPDSFNQAPLKDPARGAGDGTALVIGTGLVDLNFKSAAARTPQSGTGSGEGVIEYCQWDVERVGSHSLVYSATQSLGQFKLRIQRTVSLSGRTLTSHTVVTNLGSVALPVSWFPHPFFP